MGRTVSADLQNLLDLENCETQTTLDLYLADTSEIHVATDAFTANGETYTADLRTAGQLKQNAFSSIDRCQVTVQNIDKIIGGTVTDEDLKGAVGVLGRYYQDKNSVLPSAWVELFRGEAKPLKLNEREAQIEILHDLVAAGYCIADDNLAENCQFVFKHAGTCGYAGGEAVCNKKRKSKAGCQGRLNEHRFGGMEFPDPQVPSTPSGGEPPGPIEPPYCPRIDQWIPVRGAGGSITVVRAGELDDSHSTWNPISGSFDRIKSARIIEGLQIWSITSAAGVSGYSSGTHPVIPYREHLTGLPVKDMFDGDPLLLWRRRDRYLFNHQVQWTGANAEIGDVVHIELESGYIYAYGDNADVFVVCHNSKQIPL